ncbi:aspartate/glutamate racemase family protein [Brevibacterium paucivorans]
MSSGASSPTVGLLDSGLGLVPFAVAVHHELPHVNLALALDPDFAPYGALTSAQIEQRALASARTLVDAGARALVIACNTASVHALQAVREQFEPDIPVIGTVPAVKPAAATGAPFAVWATTATTGSAYQRSLISMYAGDINVYPVACAGLAQAIDSADPETIDIALSAAVTATPREAQSIVLGCTHYGLVADRIEAAFDRPVVLFDSPPAVARQLARRLATQVVSEDPAEVVSDPQSPQVPATPQASTPPTGRLTHVFLSGKPGSLPAAVEAYSVGRELLALQDKTE